MENNNTDNNINISNDNIEKGKILNRWNIMASLLILVVAPAIVFFSYLVLDENKFFVLSVGFVIIILLVFFLMFEGKKPDARTLIIIAVMSAIAVVGRAIFFFAPNIKPTLAIIILAGICFGRNVGFITGATAAFVSNFIFGQGPWTPWQMLAMGLVGYLAGLLFDDGKNGRRVNLYKNKPVLMTVLYCIFGFISAFFIYGGIVDLWTILGFYGDPSISSAIAVYTMAAAFNLMHAVSTVIFLILLVIPMKKKLDRIKIKYGLI